MLSDKEKAFIFEYLEQGDSNLSLLALQSPSNKNQKKTPT